MALASIYLEQTNTKRCDRCTSSGMAFLKAGFMSLILLAGAGAEVNIW